MTKRCAEKSLYLQGVKIPSGLALHDTDGGPLRVVLGREAAQGEIAAKDLPDGVVLRVPAGGPGTVLRLTFRREALHGKKGRRLLDPDAFDGEERDAYLSFAVGGMAIGARESAGYADKVLEACLRHPGPLTTAALLERAKKTLNPDYQQYDEVEGARLLAHLAGLAALGQDVPMDWVEGRISLLTSSRAIVMLSTPGVLPATAEDALLSRALHLVRSRNPQALEDHPADVIDGTRSDAERARLRRDLLRHMAAVADDPDSLVDGRETVPHRDFYADAFARAAALDGVDATPEEIRSQAREEIDAILAERTSTTGVRTVPPPPPVRRSRQRRHVPLRDLEAEQVDIENGLRTKLEKAGVDVAVIAEILSPTAGTPEPGSAEHALLEKCGGARHHRKLVEVRTKIGGIKEERWQQAERLALRDVSEPRPRLKNRPPRRPTLVADTIDHLVEHQPHTLCEDLLGVVIDPSSIAPEARKHLLNRRRNDVEARRTNLARAIHEEARIMRTAGSLSGRPDDPDDESGTRTAEELLATRHGRPSLFDQEHGPGVRAENGFAPAAGQLTEIEQRMSRPLPAKGSEEAKLAASDLFVRAQLVHAALAPGDDRFLGDVRLVVLAGDGKGSRSRLTKDSAWTTVRNLEHALYTMMALTAAWRGQLSDRKDAGTPLNGNFEDERALLLEERTRRILAEMRQGTLRLGADPERTSFACLAALKEVVWRWEKLRRELEAAMSLPQVRKSREKMTEYQESMPEYLPETLRKAVKDLPRPGRRTDTGRGREDRKSADGAAQAWLSTRSRPTRDLAGTLTFLGLDPARPAGPELLRKRLDKKRAFWTARAEHGGSEAKDVLALIEILRRQLEVQGVL